MIAMTAGQAVSKTVVLASADAALRQRLRDSLSGMRWQVTEASGGAEAMAQMEKQKPEALVMDFWLPDLEASEFAGQVPVLYPGVDVLRVDGDPVAGSTRSPRRHELLHALREALEERVPVARDGAAWMAAPVAVPDRIPTRRAALLDEIVTEPAGARESAEAVAESPDEGLSFEELAAAASASLLPPEAAAPVEAVVTEPATTLAPALPVMIPEMIGRSYPMLELARLIRLVAPRSTTVLIEGETGTGKEVVAQALHRLSSRSQKPFAVLNCAAIPESLLEAELFGHTRGAFTGAVQSRTGRIEAANGGTLFLDEIGEMPLALQAKMLRFLECGELQRVGDNETVRVDVRVIAATHQPLQQRSEERTFRLDLYHRLAVFPVEVPALRDRMEDLELLTEHILEKMGQKMPRKRLSAEGAAKLHEHHWPGNVRELMHVLERGAILSGDRMEIGAAEIRYRRATRE